jgi:PKD repeat protein
MTGRRRRAARAVFVGCVAVLVVAAAFSGASVGDEHGDIAVEQDGTCRVVNPVSTDESAEEFYQYRSPATEPHGYTYSSHGTVDYQQDDTSILLFHEGSEGTSLVIVHDRLAPEGVNGTDGGTASFEVSGLPLEGEWTVEDDDYANQTDEFVHEGTESELHWVWVDNRTDGAAFTGVESASAIRINPRFNEEAEIRPSGPREDGVISAWQAIDATDGGFDRVPLNLSEPLRIWPGSCQDGPAPAASLSANATVASAGETVRFDASGTTSLRSIAEYRWDLTGDGETDTVTAEPTLDHAFQSAGTYNVTVTAVDSVNATGTANHTVAVGEGDAPTAVLNSTGQALVNETVQFDAGGSTVDDPPATYEWRVDGETVGTTNESSYERAFESPGEYTLTVVVTDAVGRTDEASGTVTVDAPLSAAIDPPSTPIAVNESVTFDGGDSTGNVTSYGWTFGDEATDGNETNGNATDGNASDGNETTANATASGETVIHTYESAGEYTVTLTVVAADGDTAQATETVTVETPAPTAAIAAPEAAGINESVTVDANASVAASGDRRFEWRIDGEVVEDANESTLTTAFEQAGEYTVSVTVTDDTGGSDTDEVVVTVTQSLAAVIETNPDSPVVGEQVTFDGGGSAGNVTSYEWTFGDENASDGDEAVGGNVTDGNQTDENVTDGNVTDGNQTDENETASGETVTHTYERAGEYTVTLTVVAVDGETATTTVEIDVAEKESDSGDESDDGGNSGGSGGQSGGNPGGGNSAGGSSGGGSTGGGSSGGSSGGGSTGDSDTADVAPATANLSVVDLTASTAVVDRPFDVTVSVNNSGTLLGTDEVPVTVDGEERATVSVTVPPNETVTENASVTVAEVGTVRVAAGNVSVLTAVRPARANLSVSALELENGPISAGDEAVLVATVRNDGTIPAEYRVELAVAGSVSRVETVRVPPAATARIRLRQLFEAPGTYTLSVGNRSTQITVDGDDAGAADATETAETTETVDGFGALPALLAVVALTLLGRFRTRE